MHIHIKIIFKNGIHIESQNTFFLTIQPGVNTAWCQQWDEYQADEDHHYQ